MYAVSVKVGDCDETYQWKKGQRTLKCNYDGEWGAIPECIKIGKVQEIMVPDWLITRHVTFKTLNNEL